MIFTWYHIIRNCYTKLLWIMGACCAFDFPQLLPQQSLSWKLSACFICSQKGKRGKKVNEDKFMMENPLKSPVPWQLQPVPGISSRDSGWYHSEPELCPATAGCSFHLHSPKNTAVSYLQRGTLHEADYYTPLSTKQIIALLSPKQHCWQCPAS